MSINLIILIEILFDKSQYPNKMFHIEIIIEICKYAIVG